MERERKEALSTARRATLYVRTKTSAVPKQEIITMGYPVGDNSLGFRARQGPGAAPKDCVNLTRRVAVTDMVNSLALEQRPTD